MKKSDKRKKTTQKKPKPPGLNQKIGRPKKNSGYADIQPRKLYEKLKKKGSGT